MYKLKNVKCKKCGGEWFKWECEDFHYCLTCGFGTAKRNLYKRNEELRKEKNIEYERKLNEIYKSRIKDTGRKIPIFWEEGIMNFDSVTTTARFFNITRNTVYKIISNPELMKKEYQGITLKFAGSLAGTFTVNLTEKY